MSHKFKALVTAGPTREKIDPVRYISNQSSGKQGYAMAEALADAGMDVTLVSGPVALSPPKSVAVTYVESAEEMLTACTACLPVDVAVCVAAVADWRPKQVAPAKIKKAVASVPPPIELVENPDILHTLAQHSLRPGLVVGFALETGDLEVNAKAKLQQKGCDWLVGNKLMENNQVFGSDDNKIYFCSKEEEGYWPKSSKRNIADKLVAKMMPILENISKPNA